MFFGVSVSQVPSGQDSDAMVTKGIQIGERRAIARKRARQDLSTAWVFDCDRAFR